MSKREKTIETCIGCGEADILRITTYKRFWWICRTCGEARPTQRSSYPFSFLPHADVKKQKDLNAASMYDYFITPIHLELAELEAIDFNERYISRLPEPISHKSLLDISGGNGHFAKWFQDKLSMTVSFTEINEPAIEYAQANLGFENVLHYDLNAEGDGAIGGRRYDVIMARACIMFCDDINKFAEQLLNSVNPGGLLILERSLEATLGTLVRVQLDEFSYHILRQPGVVETSFLNAGFELASRYDETDPSLYVYDHDLLPHWKWLHYYYEIKGLSQIANDRVFNLPARDRRRSCFVFRAPK